MADDSEMPALLTQLSRALGARESWLVPLSLDEVNERLRQDGASPTITPVGGEPVGCIDIRDRGQKAREHSGSLIVDVTEQGMCGCAAVRLGAHVAIISCAESLCTLSVSRDVEDALPGLVGWLRAEAATGAELVADAERTVKQRSDNWCETSDAAQVVAAYLRCHPRVEEVRYPGLKSDPSFVVATRTLQRGFGPRVDYRVYGETLWRHVICEACDVRRQILAFERELKEPIVR